MDWSLWSNRKNYSPNKEINDAYIVVKGTITVTEPDNAKENKEVVFKNNAPFINCFSKINGVKFDNAEDLDVVMPKYNLLEYSKNYRKTTGILRNYYRDEPSNLFSSDSESFKYKTRIQGNTYNIDVVKLVMMKIKLVKMKLKLLFH